MNTSVIVKYTYIPDDVDNAYSIIVQAITDGF